MADPNEFGEQEMMGSFVEEGHEYQSGLGSEFSEDIKATAHFAQAQFYNLNRQNDFMENVESSPATTFQLPVGNINAIQHIHDYSLQDSDRENPNLLNSAASAQQNASQNFRKAESRPSSGTIERPELDHEQPSKKSESSILKQNGLSSSGFKPENRNELRNSFQFSQQSMDGGQQLVKSRDQGQRILKNSAQNSFFKKQQAQKSDNAHVQYLRHESINSPIQKMNEKSLGGSQPIESGQPREHQINRNSEIPINSNQNRAINIQQAVFSQVMSTQLPQRNSSDLNLQRNFHLFKGQSQGTQVVGQTRPLMDPSPQYGGSSYLNRYFPSVRSQEYNEKKQPQLLINSPNNIKAVGPVISGPSQQGQQIWRNKVVSPQGQPPQVNQTGMGVYQASSSIPTTPYRADMKPQTPVSGLNQHIQSSRREAAVEKPQQDIRVRPLQNNIPASPLPKTANIFIQQQQQQTGDRQSRIVGNQNSGLVYGSRRSISYGSTDSKGKPTVYFTYSSNVGGRPGLGESKSQVIRQHTQTVIEKTTTIVWQHRYLTVIHKFHTISERFSLVVKQLTTVTQLLEAAKGKDNLEGLYRDLLIKHTGLLEMLSQCQHEMGRFEEEANWFNKQIEHDADLKQQSLYKEKYQQLQYENTRLKEQLNRATEQGRMATANTPNQADLKQMEIRIQKMQEELTRSEAFSGELQQYIGRLEHDYNSMSEQLDKLRRGERNIVEYANLIKNQELIIRELEGELKKKPKHAEEPIQEYIKAISQLEAKVKQLEQSTHPNQNDKKYEEIIENQRRFIENIDYHFKQFEKGAASREAELRNVLKSQELTIATLENQVHTARVDPGGITKQREQALLAQLETYRGKNNQLQLQLQKLTQKNNEIKTELEAKTIEVTILKEERVTNQRSMQQKLEQKLILIEQQLKLRASETPRVSVSPSTPKLERNQQLQDLMQENDRLVSQMRKKHQEKRKLQQQLINQDENMRRKLLEKQSEIRLLNDKIKLFEEQNKRRFSEKDRKIKQLEQQIEALTNKVKSNVSTPRNQSVNQNFEIYSPPSNNQQLRSLKDRLSQKEQEVLEVQRQKDIAEKKLQALQASFNGLDEENIKKTQELMNLKRQFSNFGTFDNEIKTLTETVNKKNQQILELKSVSFEKNELKIQLESIKNERNSLKATIQSKVQEIDKLKQTINQFEAKIRQSKNRQSLFPTTTNESAVEELQIMYESMKKKQAELIKIKQSNQLLETNVQELEYQLQRAKSKIATLQKNHLHDKEDHLNSVTEYQKIIKELEVKTKSLDESQRINKTNFNVELQNLDNLLKEKQESVRKLEGENKVLKNKLKNHDSKTQDYESEVQNLNKKVKEIEAARDELKKQIQASESGTQNNNKKLYDEYQIKIVELEASIKVKDNKIKQLENNFETLKMKSGNQNPGEEDFINQQQIEVLRKKVAEYQSRLYNFGGSRINNFKARDYQSTLVFEQKAIYDLKAENQRLRSLISSKNLKPPSGQSTHKKTNVDSIQKRLIDFNQKLEEMIEQNRNLEEKSSDFSTFLQPRHQNQQIISSFERERANLLRKHRGQISGLQARLVDLQRYCSSLEFLPNNNTSTYSYTSNTKYLDSAKTVYAEQLNYYKEKNKELEERIDEHIKINKELKEKLEAALRSGGDANALEFYRMQLSQMERQTSEYLLKIKSLNEECSKLRFALQSHKNDQSAELKISELENRVHQLNRKIAQLNMQNGILQSDLQKYIQEVKIANQQSQKHRTTVHERDQKLNSVDQALREAQSKINNYEIQVVKLTNQIKLLEAEADRLNEKAKNKQAEEGSQISRLKARLLQLQTEIRQYEEHSTIWAEAKASYEQVISALNTRIANLEAEVTKLNALYSNLSKKAKDSDGEFLELQNRLQNQRNRTHELDALLQRKQTEIDSMNEFLERIKKERDNEGTQSKQRLSYISEMEETIRSLKSQISQYKSQLQRLRAEYNQNKQRLNLQGNLEEIVKQLRLEIQLHKGEIQRLKSANDQLRQKVGVSAQWEQQNIRYLTELERLRKEEQRLQAELSKLRIYVEKLEKELKTNQELTDRIAYRLEFIRSILIEIEVMSENLLVDQSNRRQVQILDKLTSSLTKGLTMCSQTFAIL